MFVSSHVGDEGGRKLSTEKSPLLRPTLVERPRANWARCRVGNGKGAFSSQLRLCGFAFRSTQHKILYVHEYGRDAGSGSWSLTSAEWRCRAGALGRPVQM
ncbi:hypothetical protein HPB50_009769 [Hyalomma asiaticum]|uniref:Uncharacterized protein n=1 Tax=Hyalomma asiaticum TaxID=266040 RepID=A0ACB7RZG0_HYAAI|nr:hypothetical protein HPB50_009769 [Hyalomma asiaticum]